MNRIVGQAKELGAEYGTPPAVPSHNSQLEEYISQLESAVGEVEFQLTELRRRLSPLLLPETGTLSDDNCVSLPPMSEAAYRIYLLTERLENLYKCLGDILSRL